MKLASIFSGFTYIDTLEATEKFAGIRELVTAMHAEDVFPPGKTVGEIFGLVRSREDLGTTGIGNGIAFPHCKVPGIDRVYVGLARSGAGIAYRAVDGQPVKVMILMLLPEDRPDEQLLIKKRVVEFLRRPNTTRLILQADSKKAILELVREEDEAIAQQN